MGTEAHCKNCGYKLITKATKKSASQLRKPYYYTAYYYCVRCQKLYHSDTFKVVNNNLFPAEPQETREIIAPQNDSSSYDAEIWTDGACVRNGTPLAKAAWAFVSGETERAGRVVGKQTNNVAEARAIYYALLWAQEQGFTRIKIYSDSLISLNNMKKPAYKVIQNTEIFVDIAEVINRTQINVTFEKVLGHSGDPNNERADKLCNGLASKQ
jgi:ribonuclease HI